MKLAIVLALAHVFFVAGCYLFASGFNLAVKGSVRPKEIFTSPLFWGLFAILGGLCVVLSPLLLPLLREALC